MLKDTRLSNFTMKYRIKADVGIIPCNLDEAKRSQLIQGLTPCSNGNGPRIRPNQ